MNKGIQLIFALLVSCADLFAGTIGLSKTSLPSFGSCPINYAAVPQRYKVWGVNMSAGILINAPLGFEVSLTGTDSYSRSILLPLNGNKVDTAQVFVRFAPLSTGAKAGVLVHSSSGSPTQNLPLAGTGVATTGIPSGYYNGINQSGQALLTALYNKISGHTVVSYSGLWTAFPATDAFYTGKVWDIYSTSIFGNEANYTFTYSTDQCGTYAVEGDCYNREHSFPQSWFSSASPMYSDMYHILPTDGKVNGMRNNYPFGEVGSTISWQSQIGGKLGTSISPNYTSTVFEPVNEYKGDIARGLLYMAARYNNLIASWQGNGNANEVLAGNAYPVYDAWFLNVLVKWHNQDPPDVKEINRQNGIYTRQNNRNPFIDSPQFVNRIWGLAKPAEPTASASQFSIDSLTPNFVRAHFITGNGNRRLVICRAGSPVNAFPLDSVQYTASSVFGSGSQLGSGNFVVYDGQGCTFSVSGLTGSTAQNYYFTVIEYNGLSRTANYQSSGWLNSLPITVPVKWLDVRVEGNSAKRTIEWQTASEENNAYFKVQRSTDAVNWIDVETVPGAGFSASIQSYRSIDVESVPQHRLYYRIEQVDRDGNNSFSKLVEWNSVEQFAPVCSPNPVLEGRITVEGLLAETQTQFRIFTTSGQEVLTKTISANANTAQILDLPLFSGAYVLHVLQGTNQFRQLIIVP
ncbi:MAG: endonuclease [Bacteroidetes bacterium]|nr:endonuclease [Bacteroidota bacterium]